MRKKGILDPRPQTAGGGDPGTSVVASRKKRSSSTESLICDVAGLEEEPLGLLDPLSSLGRRRGSHTSPDMGKKERATSLTGGGGVG